MNNRLFLIPVLFLLLVVNVSASGTFRIALSTGNIDLNNSLLVGTKLNYSDLLNVPSFVLSSTFNSFTSWYSSDNSSLNARINNVNVSGNIKSLGFNLTSELQSLFDLRYYSKSNADNIQLNVTNLNSSLDTKINNLNSTKSGVGSCAAGQVVQNTTLTGVDCVTPSGGSVGGSNTQIQYNNNSLMSGSNGARITSDGFLSIQNPHSVLPATPNSGITIYSQNRGAETVLSYVGGSSINRIVQPHFAYEDIIVCQSNHLTSSTAVPVCSNGYTFQAAVGTYSNPNEVYTTTARATIKWVLSTSSGGMAELKSTWSGLGRGNNSFPVMNGGFKMVTRYYFGGEDNLTSGCVGMMATTTAFTNTSNCFLGASSVNLLFAGFNATTGQSNISYYSVNGTAGLLNKLYDCGIAYSVGNVTDIGQMYETTIFVRPSGKNTWGNVSFYTIALHNDSIPPCVFNMDGNDGRLPVNTVLLGYHQWAGRIRGATGTTGVTTAMNKMYLTRDN